MDGLNRAPKYCVIPLTNNNLTYTQTIDAIQYIITNRLDEWLLFNIDFFQPSLGLQQNSNFYTATHIRKRPIVATEVLDNINRTIRMGGKLTPELENQKKLCEDKIKTLSLRYKNTGSQSEALKNKDIMAGKGTRTTKTKSVTPNDTISPASPASGDITPPPATAKQEEPAAVEAVVVKETTDPVVAAFNAPKAAIHADVVAISKFKEITTAEEAAQLQKLMLDLKDKKNVVDKIHKKGKAPAWAECKRWDDARKEILDGADEALNGTCKMLLHGWDLKQREAEAERQRLADLERARLDNEAKAEADRISNIKVELDQFEQNLAKKIIEAKDNIALGKIWQSELAPFVPTEQTHGPFTTPALEMKDRLVALGQACSKKIDASEEWVLGRIPEATKNQIFEQCDITIRQYTFQQEQAILQNAVITETAVEQAAIASEVQKSEITGAQIMQQATPMLKYRRQWRWEVQNINEVGAHLKIAHPAQPMYIQVDGKFVQAFSPTPATEFYTIDNDKIKTWLDKENAGDNPLTNGEVVDGLAFYVEETPVMPRS